MIHVKDLYKMLEIFIEARDTLAEITEAGKKLNIIISKMDDIIKETHEE